MGETGERRRGREAGVGAGAAPHPQPAGQARLWVSPLLLGARTLKGEDKGTQGHLRVSQGPVCPGPGPAEVLGASGLGLRKPPAGEWLWGAGMTLAGRGILEGETAGTGAGLCLCTQHLHPQPSVLYRSPPTAAPLSK